MAESFAEMACLNFRDAFNRQERQNATFHVNGKIPRFDEPIVWENMKNGFEEVRMICKGKTEELVKIYKSVIQTPWRMRIVPVKTGVFYRNMNAYFDEGEQRENVIQAVTELIMEDLQKRYGNFWESKPNADAITKLAGRAFFWGDIPLFQLENNPGSNPVIYQDGQEIAKLKKGYMDIGEEKFRQQIAWLGGEKAMEEFNS